MRFLKTISGLASGTRGAVPPRRPSASRIVSPAIYVAILVAFALPFGTVSCNGPAVHFTGYQLATGSVPQTTPPATTDEGDSLRDAIESKASSWALLMLLAAITGFALGVAGRRGGGIAAIVGLVGVVGLIAQSFDMGGPTIEYEEGFRIAAFLFAIAAVWHAVVSVVRRRRRRSAGTQTSAAPPGALPRL